MNNRARFSISLLISALLAVIAYLLPYTLILYFFAPGFWIGDALPNTIVNALGGYLFPVIVSVVLWTFLIFGISWLMARGRIRRPVRNVRSSLLSSI
jgi:hypothetical protein